VIPHCSRPTAVTARKKWGYGTPHSKKWGVRVPPYLPKMMATVAFRKNETKILDGGVGVGDALIALFCSFGHYQSELSDTHISKASDYVVIHYECSMCQQPQASARARGACRV